MEVCKLESYSTKTVTIICIKHNFQQYCFHCKLVPIKLHIVTASGISVIITTCFVILSLFNPVLIFKIAFTNSALILLFNFNFTMFIWPITRFITELECGIGVLRKTSQFFVWVFSDGISIRAYFSPICHCVSNIFPMDNYQILSLVFNFPNDFTFKPKFIQKLN